MLGAGAFSTAPGSPSGGGVATTDSPTWTGTHIWDVEDAGTNTVPTPITVEHRNNAAGTPAAGYGIGILMRADSSARNLRSVVELDAVWVDPTDTAEVGALAVKTRVAGVLTEIARLGGTGPDVDASFVFGRALIDSRATDIAYFSHRDMTATTQYAIFQNALGAVRVNCASGQTLGLYHNNGIRLQVNSTGMGFFGVAPVAQQALTGSRGGNAAVASIATALANLGLCTDGTTA